VNTAPDVVLAPTSPSEVIAILDILMDAKSQAVLAEVDAASCGTKRDCQRADEAQTKLDEVSVTATEAFLALLRERKAFETRALTAERKLREVAASIENIERIRLELVDIVKNLPESVRQNLRDNKESK
jgi:hypothetical protein